MEWEVWAERVPFTGFRRTLIRISREEFYRMSSMTGIPVAYCWDGGLRVWPSPSAGWIAKAYNGVLMLTREAAVPLAEEGPW